MQKTSVNQLVSKHACGGARKYVFFDTCAVLDILRLPAKYGDNTQNLLSYKELLNKAKAGNVVFVASYMNYIEQQCNKAAAEKTEADEENVALKKLKKFDNYASTIGVINSGDFLGAFSTVLINDYLHDLYDGYVNAIVYLNEKMEYDRFAMQRVAAHIPPAELKGEYKDCYIWRTCVELSKNVKANDEIYFFTTNPKDFQVSPTSRHQMQLQLDAPNVKILFDVNHLNACI